MGHFVSFPREREKREEIVEEIKERDRGERNMNESEETKEIKTFPSTLTCYKDNRPFPTVKPISVGRPGDVRYTTPLPHPTTPFLWLKIGRSFGERKLIPFLFTPQGHKF